MVETVILFVILSIVFCVVIRKIVDYIEENEQSGSSSQHKIDNNEGISYTRTNKHYQTTIIDDTLYTVWNEDSKIWQFWRKATQYVIEYIDNYDIDTLKEFIYNIWETRDKVESARELHSLLELTVERLHIIRDYNRGYDSFEARKAHLNRRI